MLRNYRLALLAASVQLILAQPSMAADSALITAAQREGIVRWYTVVLVEEAVRPLVAAFKKSYPGIEVAFERDISPANARKIIAEAAAPRADVFDGSITAAALLQAGLVAPYKPDSAKDIPDQFKDKDGYWTALLLEFNSLGRNTDLVPESATPRSWAELLDPRWHGKIVWSVRDGLTSGAGVVANVLSSMGESEGFAYLARLKQQKIAGINGDGPAVLREISSGRYALALQIFTHHTVIERGRGAHVDWVPLEPVLGFSNNIGLVKNAPHPNAGKLLIDFILSVGGQTIIRDANHIPASSKVEALVPSLKTGFQVNFMSPAMVAAHGTEWQAIFDRLFR